MKKSIALLMILTLIMTMIPGCAFAAIDDVAEPTEVTELFSSENLEHNFVKVTASGSTLKVEVETPIEACKFGLGYRKVGSGQNNVWKKTGITHLAELCLPMD